MKKSGSIVLSILFLLAIFFVPICTKLQANATYSFFENRTLANAPVLNLQSLLSGEYFSSWNTYLADHMCYREKLLANYISINMNVLKKTVVNDTVVQNDMLLPYYVQTVLDYNTINNNIGNLADSLDNVNDYVEKMGSTFLFVGMPEQSSLFADKQPNDCYSKKDYFDYVEKSLFDQLDSRSIDYVDMKKVFSGCDDYQKYYSTIDHHYNYYGALKTYQTILEKLEAITADKFDILQENDMDISAVNYPAVGSRSIKLYNLYPTDEKVYIGYPKVKVPFTRVDNDKDEVDDLFTMPYYSTSYASYTIYMGGDKGKTVISTNRPDKPTVLIWGDSFTNALETIMYYNFDKAIYLDFRHITDGSTIYDYLDEYKPHIVICVSNDTVYAVQNDNVP